MLQKDELIAQAKQTCNLLIELRRQHLAAVRQKNRIYQGMLHVTHRMIAPDEDLAAGKNKFKAGLDKTAAKLDAYLKKGEPMDVHPGVMAFIDCFKEGSKPFERLSNDLNKSFATHVDKLPVYEWWVSHPGLGAGGLGKVIGDAGYIGTYRRPAGLWKRMGLMNVRVTGNEKTERIHDINASVLDEFHVTEVLKAEFEGREYPVDWKTSGEWYMVGEKLVRTTEFLGGALDPESIRLTVRCIAFDGKVARACGQLKKASEKAKLTSEEWVEIGYSPQRRSTMYTITDSLLKKQMNLTEKAKETKESDRTKMHPHDRWTAGGEYGRYAIKRRVSTFDRCWTPIHANLDMHRVVAKRLLEDLFYVWKRHTGEPIDYSHTWS